MEYKRVCGYEKVMYGAWDMYAITRYLVSGHRYCPEGYGIPNALRTYKWFKAACNTYSIILDQ